MSDGDRVDFVDQVGENILNLLLFIQHLGNGQKLILVNYQKKLLTSGN